MQARTGPTAVFSRRVVRFAVAGVLAAGAALVPAGTAVAKPTATPEQKATATVMPAMVYLEVHWQGWVRDRITDTLVDTRSITVTSQCSGFAVTNDGYLVTAGDCVDPEAIAPAFFQAVADRRVQAGTLSQADEASTVADLTITAEVGGQSLGEPLVREVWAQRGVAKPGLTSGEALPAQVVSFEPVAQGDVGLVKIERSNQPVASLADGSDLQAGTDLLALGYPPATGSANDTTLEPASQDGKISAEHTEGEQTLYETTATASQSMTGGPVIDLNGNVIGLVSPGPGTEQQSYNYVTPAAAIAAALDKAGVKNALGKIDKDYRAGLAAYFDGRYTEAIEAFDQVLAALPSHTQAYEFRQDAVKLRNTEGEPAEVERSLINRYGSTIIVVAAAIVLILGLVLGGRWRSRAATTPGSPPDPTTPDPTTPDPTTAGATTPDPTEPAESTAAKVATLPVLDYCVNCGVGSPPGTERCETCGKQFA